MSTVAEKKGLVLGLRHNGIRLTPEEFDAIDEYDERYAYELINGVLVVNAMPSFYERDSNEELGHWLRSFQEQHPEIIDKTVFEEYVRTHNGRRRADRVIWTGLGRLPNPDTDMPTIVVEFVSKRRRDWLRDYVEKRDEYLALGIREYWVINRFQRNLTIFRMGGSGLEELTIVGHQVYRPALLPGFELPIGRLLNTPEDFNDPEPYPSRS